MKVKLKLTVKQISALVYAFDQVSKAPAKGRIAKVAKSALDKVVLKVKTKQLQVQQKSNLFNDKEKFSFALELVEAHFLEQYLVSMSEFPMCEYDKNAINQISATINQQLA
ncbi:hypothetical protein [Flavobacterium geliluteum]|uniref:Uncharacterized protein n=1 Tax=Flavobacterium geliluteum TaxID=2816120 RepID=A0A940X533_9FLAO|nr:hypothetical protein [Flavobacterium geliluteum]MBP4137433.1 hypothetical protein [Flavobacterium geliluteum]